MAPTETEEEEAKHRLAFVRRENWLLLLHAGAPGTDMKRVLWAPMLNLYTLGTMSPRHILCTSITYATPCVPHTLSCVYPDARSTLRPMDTVHLDRAPRTTSYLLHDALCTTYHLLNPMPTVSGPIPGKCVPSTLSWAHEQCPSCLGGHLYRNG